MTAAELVSVRLSMRSWCVSLLLLLSSSSLLQNCKGHVHQAMPSARPSRPHSPRVVALLAGVVLCVALLSLPVSAQYGSPVFNFGESIPLTVYVRLHRQSQSFLHHIMRGGGDVAVDEDAEVPVDAKTSTNEDFIDAMLAANTRGAAGVLAIEEGADTIGRKHAMQVQRLIPSQQAPRFAVDNTVVLPAKGLYDEAAAQMRRGSFPEESDLALRLSVGKGLRKETTWIPVATLSSRLRSHLSELLSPDNRRELAELDDEAQDQDSPRPAREEADPIYYLTSVSLNFGFQSGVVNRMTSMRYEFGYSRTKPQHLVLHYLWDEHRAYNPHMAITACSTASVVVALWMLFSIVGLRTGKAAKQFRKHTVVVRHHEE